MTLQQLIDKFIFACEYHIYDADSNVEDVFTFSEIIENKWLNKKVIDWQFNNANNKLYIDI